MKIFLDTANIDHIREANEQQHNFGCITSASAAFQKFCPVYWQFNMLNFFYKSYVIMEVLFHFLDNLLKIYLILPNC